MKFSARRSIRYAILNRGRNNNGQVISETGPALFILFIVVLFPLIDMLYLALAFGVVWYLNYLEVRELAVRLPTETQQVIDEVDDNYVTLGLGKFVGLTKERINHPIPGKASRSTDVPPFVTCTTEATINPFLNIPFLFPVVGINQPVTFSVTSTRLQEELGRD